MTLEDLNEDKRHIERLIDRYRELSESWNGKDLHTEQLIQDVAGELEDYGISVDNLD